MGLGHGPGNTLVPGVITWQRTVIVPEKGVDPAETVRKAPAATGWEADMLPEITYTDRGVCCRS